MMKKYFSFRLMKDIVKPNRMVITAYTTVKNAETDKNGHIIWSNLDDKERHEDGKFMCQSQMVFVVDELKKFAIKHKDDDKSAS